jgi:hypothetical protein
VPTEDGGEDPSQGDGYRGIEEAPDTRQQRTYGEGETGGSLKRWAPWKQSYSLERLPRGDMRPIYMREREKGTGAEPQFDSGANRQLKWPAHEPPLKGTGGKSLLPDRISHTQGQYSVAKKHTDLPYTPWTPEEQRRARLNFETEVPPEVMVRYRCAI